MDIEKIIAQVTERVIAEYNVNHVKEWSDSDFQYMTQRKARVRRYRLWRFRQDWSIRWLIRI